MRDITNPTALWFKGSLFLGLGLFAAILLLMELPTLKGALLLGLCIWAFCRAYYFAFYVIGHYVDPSFKFSGLGDFLKYMVTRKKG